MAKAHSSCPVFKKGSNGKKHSKCRPTCKKCGISHTASEHRFHGRGSFNRTH